MPREWSEQPERREWSEWSEQPERRDRPEYLEQSEGRDRLEQPDQWERREQPDQFDQRERQGRLEQTDQRERRGRRRRQSRPVDPRPYIRDVANGNRGPAGVLTATIGMVLLALMFGFVIGFLVFLVMNLSIWLTSLLWDRLGGAVGMPWFSLVVCTLGGLVIGLWTHFSGSRVEPLEVVMRKFKETGSYDLGGTGKATVSFLLPLVFGGSVGFEAGLTGIITAACCWMRDRLKAAGLRVASLADVTISASLAAIFGTPLAGIVAGAESAPQDGEDVLEEPDVDDYNMRRGAKLVLYTAAAFGAFAGIRVFSSLFGASAGFPFFGEIETEGTGYLWAILALLVAYLLTWLYHGSRYGFTRLAYLLDADERGTVLKPIIAGVVLGAMAMAFPYVLFSGETQCHDLMNSWTTWTAVALMFTGILKAVATPMCISMGWIGGNFCPSIFAGAACGYGLSMITGADPMLMVTIVTTAFLSGVLRKPLLAIAVLMLCFPIQDILWMGIAAIVGGSLPLPSFLLASDEME